MKSILLLLLWPIWCFSQQDSRIETADIDRFWAAFDLLPTAKTKGDSIAILQRHYIDRASKDFKKFIQSRQFTAQEYVDLIGRHPAFWSSIRPLTERISGRKEEIQQVFDRISAVLPDFKRPDVCFAIGCLRSGGTTSKRLILIGAEIAAADATVDKTGFNQWLKSVLGQTGDIVSMVAHEAVHTQQKGFPVLEIFSLIKHRKLNLLNMSIVEGSADFITMRLLGLNINAPLHEYGDAHQTTLFEAFKKGYAERPFDTSNWLYNGGQSKGQPADLGYYIGCKITEDYYERARNKRKALKTILKIGRYKKIYRASKFGHKSRN